VAEEWSVLELDCDAAAGADAGTAILDAIAHAVEAMPTPAGDTSAEIIVLAERGCATSAAMAILAAPAGFDAPQGLVTIDAFAETGFLPLGAELAACDRLATIWTVARGAADLRNATLAYHASLQAQGRDSHFLVLPDVASSLAAQAAGARTPLGRELRWLLAPVHSR
jgi:hypothetical protein